MAGCLLSLLASLYKLPFPQEKPGEYFLYLFGNSRDSSNSSRLTLASRDVRVTNSENNLIRLREKRSKHCFLKIATAIHLLSDSICLVRIQ